MSEDSSRSMLKRIAVEWIPDLGVSRSLDFWNGLRTSSGRHLKECEHFHCPPYWSFLSSCFDKVHLTIVQSVLIGIRSVIDESLHRYLLGSDLPSTDHRCGESDTPFLCRPAWFDPVKGLHSIIIVFFLIHYNVFSCGLLLGLQFRYPLRLHPLIKASLESIGIDGELVVFVGRLLLINIPDSLDRLLGKATQRYFSIKSGRVSFKNLKESSSSFLRAMMEWCFQEEMSVIVVASVLMVEGCAARDGSEDLTL
ncbi:hypothetical protein Tco_0968849 [Tanacetum coccineum]